MDARWKSRVFTDLADSDLQSASCEVRDIYCPALHGLPSKHAWTIAQLPIHDANRLLLEALSHRPSWPAHVWACVYPADPFRTPEFLLRALRQHSVTKVCSFPIADVLPGFTLPGLHASTTGAEAVQVIAVEAQRQEMEFWELSRDEVELEV